ncbi:MAG: GST-like protein [Parasphingorhabdus sp.]|jgi:GST-like protein
MSRPDLKLYYSSTPNGHKPLLLLEELQVPYSLIPVDLNSGEQYSEAFSRISPNNRIPALQDFGPLDNGENIEIFESAAILYYLAEKYQRFIPSELRLKLIVNQWLYWQMSALGPMAGQAHHFLHYAPVTVDYGINRYVTECSRLYQVLERRLTNRNYIADQYSIADMAIWGWVMRHHRHQQNLDDFPAIRSWFNLLEQRPAVQKVREIAAQQMGVNTDVDDDARAVLFKLSSDSK